MAKTNRSTLLYAVAGLIDACGILELLRMLALYCENKASNDENLVVQEYHDQWMAARTEILRCADTIRKGW